MSPLRARTRTFCAGVLCAMETVCSLELDEISVELDESKIVKLDELGAIELDKTVSELDERADELDAFDELDNVAELEKIDELEDVAELDRTDELDTAAELDETEELDDIDEDDLMVISTVKVM